MIASLKTAFFRAFAATLMIWSVSLAPAGAFNDFERGLLDANLDRFSEAQADFDRCVKENPKDALAYMNRARLDMHLGKMAACLADCDRALSLDPRLPQPYGLRGYIRLSNKEYEKGLDDLNKAIALEQTDLDPTELQPVETFINRAKVLRILGKNNLAVKDEQVAKALQVVHQANLKREAGEVAVARQLLDQALKLNSSEPNCWFLRGIMCSNNQEFWPAIADFSHAIRLAPNSPVGYYFRADAYEQLGQHDKAVDDLTRIIEMRPRLVAFRYVCETGRMRDRFEGHDCYPVDLADIYYLRARSEMSAGLSRRAIEDLNQAVKLNPRDKTALTQRGDLILSLGRSNTALEDYTRAIQINKSDWQAYYQRAAAYEKMGDYKNAIADCGSIIALNPTDPGGYLLRARLLDKTHQYQKAVSDYSAIIKFNPDDDDAYRCRAYCYEKLGRNQEAKADFAKATAIDPGPNPSARKDDLSEELAGLDPDRGLNSKEQPGAASAPAYLGAANQPDKMEKMVPLVVLLVVAALGFALLGFLKYRSSG